MNIFSLLLLGIMPVTEEVPKRDGPLIEVVVNNTKIPIDCSTNPALTAGLELQAKNLEEILKLLRDKRNTKSISLQENDRLFGGELELFTAKQFIAIRDYAEFYCRNPELIPKGTAPAPVGTVSFDFKLTPKNGEV